MSTENCKQKETNHTSKIIKCNGGNQHLHGRPATSTWALGCSSKTDSISRTSKGIATWHKTVMSSQKPAGTKVGAAKRQSVFNNFHLVADNDEEENDSLNCFDKYGDCMLLGATNKSSCDIRKECKDGSLDCWLPFNNIDPM
jgi:hypothetical protein